MPHRKCLSGLTTILAVFFFVSFAIAQQTAKYVFLFIGDGMGAAQRQAAELYLAYEKGIKSPERAELVMNTFPAQGMNTTYDLSGLVPDSASSATAISTGMKTKSGVIGMDAEGKISYETIAETAKRKGWKVGILTTVSLDDATPAAFYAHVSSRKQRYDISMQLANSGFDYFAGGQILEPRDKRDPAKPGAINTAKANGYTIAMGREEFENLKPGAGKVIAMNRVVDAQAAMYYSLDQSGSNEHITLAECLDKGIELLDNPNGFFIMAEGGKIDWACHANDGAASIHDTLALDAAAAEAMKFYRAHPNETLIVVTGDHETGGMTVGSASAQYSVSMDKIQRQKMSHIEFGKQLAEYRMTHSSARPSLEDLMPLIQAIFGLYVLPADERAALEKTVADGRLKDASEEAQEAAEEAERKMKFSMALTDSELKALQEAFTGCMQRGTEREKPEYSALPHGGHEPLIMKLTTVLNNKSGISWTSNSHTGAPLPTSAIGVGADSFNGYYDQADIHRKMMRITGFQR